MLKPFLMSIVVPVYQNQGNLGSTVPALLGLKDKLRGECELELVFVDDGSDDASLDILLSFRARYGKCIKVVSLTKNFGQMAAIQAGLDIASGDCVGIISADLQDDPGLFIHMYQKWRTGAKLVVAERRERDGGLVQNTLSGLYWGMINRLAVKDFPEGGFDFCLADRQVIDSVNRIREKNSHIFILMFTLGYRYEKIYYTRRDRTVGKSQWTLGKKIKLFIDTFISFSYFPIRMISLTGVVVSGVSFAIGIWALVQKLCYGNSFTGWTSMFVLLAFLGGSILLSLGLIGEYLWRILDEARKRPKFVVDSMYL